MVGDGSHLSAGEAADLLRLSQSTVSRMFDEGDQLDGYATERGGHRRVSAVSVTRVLLRRSVSPQRDAALELLRQSGVDVDAVARELEGSPDS